MNCACKAVIRCKFLCSCLTYQIYFLSTQRLNFAFSLGWKVDVCSVFGHTREQIASMMSLIKAFQLDKSAGIVLAVNARLLAKNMQPFESFLDAYPEGQLLCWVGSGEPPIAQRKVKRIYRHFEAHGSIHRIGFDVKVREIQYVCCPS